MDGIEIHDERFRSMMPGNARLETLGVGCRWLEGPVWFADHHCLYVSDVPNDRVLRWSAPDGLSVFQQPSGFANGHARDREGRLLTCSHRGRCVTRGELDGRVTMLASHVDGKPLNSPNDVICQSDGTIWFTDPPYGIETDYEGGKQVAELPPTLYRLDPASGVLAAAASDFEGPNGLAFSPDETLLYVSETGHQFAPEPRRHIRRFTLDADGKLSGGDIFHTVSPGYADGFRVDEAGNLWTSAADGVHCIDPEGCHLGTILVPTAISNLCFGGRHHSRLFLCGGDTLFAIYTNVRGIARP